MIQWLNHDDFVKVYGITKFFPRCFLFVIASMARIDGVMDSQATVASSADSTPCKRSAKTRRCTSSTYHGKINI